MQFVSYFLKIFLYLFTIFFLTILDLTSISARLANPVVESNLTSNLTTSTAATPRESGFNELFSMGQILFVASYDSTGSGPFKRYCQNQSDGKNCPENAVALPVYKINDLLYQFQINGRLKLIRDIIPLRVLEPVVGSFPFDNDLAAVLKVYAMRDIKLILSFGQRQPSWIDSETLKLFTSQKIKNFSDFPSIKTLSEAKQKDYLKDHLLTKVIADFLLRMKNIHKVSQSWMKNKLILEPMNEINKDYSSDPTRAAQFDSLLKNKLIKSIVPHLEVTSSSLLTGSEWQFLDWFWKYYAAGGTGRPNIHLYFAHSTYNASGDYVILDGNDVNKAYSRFSKVINELNSHSHYNSNMRKVIVSEVGLPAAGIPEANNLASERLTSFNKIENVLSDADLVVHWRLFKDFLVYNNIPIRCNDENCGQIQAFESTFGYMSFYFGQLETDFKNVFAPYYFNWTPQN
jgi:hypothetical protein